MSRGFLSTAALVLSDILRTLPRRGARPLSANRTPHRKALAFAAGPAHGFSLFDDEVCEIPENEFDITERTRMKVLSRDRGGDFSGLAENLAEFICRLDTELRFLYASPAVSTLGTQPHQLLGKTAAESGALACSSPAFSQGCYQVFGTGRPLDLELDHEDRRYRFRIIPEISGDRFVDSVMVIGRDITDQRQSEAELRRLSARLVDLQDMERRRIARELHDGTAQNLFAININLEHLLELASQEELRVPLRECLALCEQSRNEIRTLSYLLHPPMLDEDGLVSALKSYAAGFAKRSGIEVKFLEVKPFGRLPVNLEADLFRIVQESLTNIHLHSGSSTAVVQLDRRERDVVVRVSDHGRGMQAKDADGGFAGFPGVGISGMRERVRQYGGRLEIQSTQQGTTVTATVPVAQPLPLGMRAA